MKIFVTVLDEGSLAGASRRLGCSPAAVSRAIAFLEQRVGAELLHLTARSLKISEAGERYGAMCRRMLGELKDADIVAADERWTPRRTLSLTAPVMSGEEVLQPILEAFMDASPAVNARLYLLDRKVNLMEEGVDAALRIGHLAGSAQMAILVGEVRRVVVAAPRYLAQHPRIAEPDDLAAHQIIATTQFESDSWSFLPLPGSSLPRIVRFVPRLTINSVRGAVASAVDGRGVTRVFSYQVADRLREGELEVVLARDEHPPLPVHLIASHGRLSARMVREFVDFAVPRLRRHFSRLADLKVQMVEAA